MKLQNESTFSSGRLILAGFLPIVPEGQPLNEAYAQTQEVKVPKKTTWVSVSVVRVDMSFVKDGTVSPGDVSSIWFAIDRHNYSRVESKGIFAFDFKAVLQNTKDPNNTGLWQGEFTVEVLCFGDG